MTRTAIGVVRVSRVGDREGESFVSPSEQRDRITAACERDGLILADVLEELDISGGATLEKRHGLRQAVELIESKKADVIVVAYFDRLVRSLTVQAEVVGRVEKAGGAILAVDIGEVRADTASRWLSSTMLGMVSEYHRRVTAERTVEAKRRAIARGVPTFDRIPPGYMRLADRTVAPDPATAPFVTEAFKLRAGGMTVMDVKAFLQGHGIKRSFHGVQAMLQSRFYLGELHFGAMENKTSHEAIVDVATWTRVQKMVVPRGRRAKSDRLLARLGVLRCATCDARLVMGIQTQNGRRYPFYRCPTVSDCPRKVTIGAEIVEAIVIAETKQGLSRLVGEASFSDKVKLAEADVARCQVDLDTAVHAFDGLNVDSARGRLLELQERLDVATVVLDELREIEAPGMTISAATDWDKLSLDERRALVRALIARVVVAPGRGTDRITVEPLRK